MRLQALASACGGMRRSAGGWRWTSSSLGLGSPRQPSALGSPGFTPSLAKWLSERLRGKQILNRSALTVRVAQRQTEGKLRFLEFPGEEIFSSAGTVMEIDRDGQILTNKAPSVSRIEAW